MFEAVIGPPARAEDRAEAERIAAYYARLGTLRAAFMMRKLFAEELRNTSYLDTLDRVTKANLTSNGPYHWTCVFRPDDFRDLLLRCIHERAEIAVKHEMAIWPLEGKDEIWQRIKAYLMTHVGEETWKNIGSIENLPTLSAIDVELERIVLALKVPLRACLTTAHPSYLNYLVLIANYYLSIRKALQCHRRLAINKCIVT
jgi:hypothetical protein